MRTIDGVDDSYDEIDKGIWKIWRNADGLAHRDGDLPAVIWDDGTLVYYKDGNPHRDGGLPAIIDDYGREEYWIEGVKQK